MAILARQRAHSSLIHHILAKMHFAPPELLFPVSAVMLRNASAYARILEEFSSREVLGIWASDNEGSKFWMS